MQVAAITGQDFANAESVHQGYVHLKLKLMMW